MSKTKPFSIIIPTYTGEEAISGCFEAILGQKDIEKYKFEMVVVIDGPNARLRKIVDGYQKIFSEKKYSFRIVQFKENKGRLIARLTGAENASTNWLLFLDDRVRIEPNYLVNIVKYEVDAALPYIIKTRPDNLIGETLFQLKKKIIYKSSYEVEKSYYINVKNFEQSQKGTTSLWVRKELFIRGCRELQKDTVDLKTVSDDTKLFKYLIKNNVNIYRNAQAKIKYQYRQNFKQALSHLYNRGPKFVNYYSGPGTRYFLLLVLFWILILLCPILILLTPNLIVPMLIAYIFLYTILVVYLSYSITSFFSLLIGVQLVLITFGLGLLRGTLHKITNGKI